MVAVFSTSLFLIGLVGALVYLTRHILSSPPLPATTDWIDALSIDLYRPMLRLLDPAELDFVRAQPGFRPQMATRLRIQRCLIFREYLRNLEHDFKLICTAIKVIMVQSKHDRPDLASALVRKQITFAYGVMIIQSELLCYRYGLGTVDIAALMKLFDGMRMELRTFVPCELAAGA